MAVLTETTRNPLLSETITSSTNRDLTDNLVSDGTRVIFQWVFYSGLCQFMCIFGTVTNIINIVCFVKLKFKDPVNISLFGLACSDLGCLVTLMWTNICYNPGLLDLDLPFDPIDIQYLTGAWPHATFTRISICITAFITLERCLCITIPLKVKTIFTPHKVIAIISAIFIILLVSVAPLYHANRIALKFDQARNKTILGLVFADDREYIEGISFTINNGLIPGTAFITVIVCTMTLVVSLRMKTKWRLTSTSSAAADSISTREQKVAKMVVCISVMFICCFLPVCIIIIAIVLEPALSIDGKYRNTLISVCSVSFTLEAANSAANIFVYYYMSSKYREMFLHLLSRSK